MIHFQDQALLIRKKNRLSDLLVFTNKIINETLAQRMKWWLSMTKAVRLFEGRKAAGNPADNWKSYRTRMQTGYERKRKNSQPTTT